MNSKAIVTLSDSNYFELLLELIESIKRFKESKDISICVLDAGLTKEQKQIKNLFALRKNSKFRMVLNGRKIQQAFHVPFGAVFHQGTSLYY